MTQNKEYKVPVDRPAFLVDEHLKAAAEKAAKAFREEEEELKKITHAST